MSGEACENSEVISKDPRQERPRNEDGMHAGGSC